MAKGEVIENGSPKQVLEKLPQDLKEQLLEVVNFWHDKYEPGHFQTRAIGKYGYEPRTRKYSDRKEKKYGHRRPLEFSGDSKREAGRGIRLTTRQQRGQTYIQARGTMNVPKYFYYQPGGVDMPFELTMTTGVEEDQMARVYHDKATEAIAKRKHKTRRRRVRG